MGGTFALLSFEFKFIDYYSNNQLAGASVPRSSLDRLFYHNSLFYFYCAVKVKLTVEEMGVRSAAPVEAMGSSRIPLRPLTIGSVGELVTLPEGVCCNLSEGGVVGGTF